MISPKSSITLRDGSQIPKRLLQAREGGWKIGFARHEPEGRYGATIDYAAVDGRCN